jgi:hypothetical protein
MKYMEISTKQWHVLWLLFIEGKVLATLVTHWDVVF